MEFWVPAGKSLALVGRELGGDYLAVRPICERAHAGLLKARAELFIAGEDRRENAPVPAEFWWAEGDEALHQDWRLGDFETWTDQKVRLRAFGVQFDFEGLRRLVPPEKAGSALRELSVSSDPEWVHANEARKFAYERLGLPPISAGSYVVNQCRLGFLTARAQLMQRRTYKNSEWSGQEREWDIPAWFWENFTAAGSSMQDWNQGTFKGSGRAPFGGCNIELIGVYFSKEGLAALLGAPANPIQDQDKGGRPRKDWWDDLWCALWGDVYRGEFDPKTQAEIVARMMDWVEGNGDSVSESTVKPRARKMLAELNRDGKN